MSKKKKQKSNERRGNPPSAFEAWVEGVSRAPRVELGRSYEPRWPMMGLQLEIEDQEEDYALAVDIEAAKHLVNRLTEAIARAEERRK
jgi:hypothetical protein